MDCESSHNKKHVMMKIKSSQPVPKIRNQLKLDSKHNIVCSLCLENTIVGASYQCVTCKKHNLCEKCYFPNMEGHHFLKIQFPGIPITNVHMQSCVGVHTTSQNANYGCRKCRVFLCESCATNHLSTHKSWTDIFRLKKEEEEKNSIHKYDSAVIHGRFCDWRDVNKCLGIRGIRWACAVCYSFDLCEICELGNGHKMDHPLIKITHQGIQPYLFKIK